jgi:hypothetical protein
VDKYKNQTADRVKKNELNTPKVVSANPLDNLNCKGSLIYTAMVTVCGGFRSHLEHFASLSIMYSSCKISVSFADYYK